MATVNIDFAYALQSLRSMNQYKTNFLELMGDIGGDITYTNQIYTGSLADQYRTKLAGQMGHNAVNSSGGIHGAYTELNNVLYKLNTSVKEQARVNGVDGEYANTIFEDDQVESMHNNAWNFDYQSGTEQVRIEDNVLDVFKNMQAKFENAENNIDQFISSLDSFLNSGYSTDYNEDIRSYCNTIKSSIGECISIINEIINNGMTEQVTETVAEASTLGNSTNGTYNPTTGYDSARKSTSVASGQGTGTGSSMNTTDASVRNKFNNTYANNDNVISWEYHEGNGDIRTATYHGQPVVGDNFRMSNEYITLNPAATVSSGVTGVKADGTGTAYTFFADGSYIEAVVKNAYTGK